MVVVFSFVTHTSHFDFDFVFAFVHTDFSTLVVNIIEYCESFLKFFSNSCKNTLSFTLDSPALLFFTLDSVVMCSTCDHSNAVSVDSESLLMFTSFYLVIKSSNHPFLFMSLVTVPESIAICLSCKLKVENLDT